MPIDFSAIKVTIIAMQGELNDLYRIVGTAEKGGFSDPTLGDVPFTQEQIDTLTAGYQSKKGNLATLFGELI